MVDGDENTTIMADNFLKRYLDGEHEAVCAELLALGPRVREEPYFEPARAVCREMARRSRLNLVILINRLCELDYQFWSRAVPPHLVRLSPDNHDQWRQQGLWVPPTDICEDTAGRLDHCEKNGIFIPLAVRVWMEDIDSSASQENIRPCARFTTIGSTQMCMRILLRCSL
jgi:hypothetical protein